MCGTYVSVWGKRGQHMELHELENTPLATWVGSCEACGRVHALREWSALPFLRVDPGAGVRADEEVRLCGCGSEVSAPITVDRLRGPH